MPVRIKRMGAALMAVLLVVAVLFFALFAIAEVGHDCTGEDCPICHILHDAAEQLRLLGFGLFMLLALLLAAHGTLRLAAHQHDVYCSETLVGLKVQLND